MKQILIDAEQTVYDDRRQDYGSITDSFERIAKMWSGILDIDVTAEQVALCMMSLKIIRESHKHKRDNLIDLIGYTLCLSEITDE